MDTTSMTAILRLSPAFPKGVSLITIGLVVQLVIAAFFLREAIKRFLNR